MLKNLLATFLRFACYDFKKNLLTLTDLFTLKASSVKLVFYFIFLFYPFTQLSEELFYSIFSHYVSDFQDGDDYSCQAGLSCVQTKLFIMKKQKAYVKQCVPEGMKIDVETVNKDHDQTSRNSRLLPGLSQLPRQVRN